MGSHSSGSPGTVARESETLGHRPMVLVCPKDVLVCQEEEILPRFFAVQYVQPPAHVSFNDLSAGWVNCS